MDIGSLLEKIIGNPKSSTLEYKAVLPTSKIMAQLISSFANSDGGYIVLGISEDLEINGISGDFNVDAIVKKALSLLTPLPIITSQFVLFKGKKLFVITVDKSERTILLGEKKYMRIGFESKLISTPDPNFNEDGYIYKSKEQNNLGDAKSKSISYHAYDINLTKSYSELEKQYENLTNLKQGTLKEEYLSQIKERLESYSKFHGLGSFDTFRPIILKYPAYNYPAHLAFQLMTFDVNKIHSMLDFQHENYLGLDQFQTIVEHGVYDWIKLNSPFDNNLRLQKIMEWVERKKNIIYKKNKIAIKIGSKILESFKIVKADVGHTIMFGIVQKIHDELTSSEKKEFDNVFSGMVLENFISYDIRNPNFVVLDSKGYRRIYEQEEKIQSFDEVVENKKLPIVVILTAIKEEYAAVRLHLDSKKNLKKDSIMYEEGIFNYHGQEIAKIVIRECGAKNPSTAQETQRAITNFRPQCILFVGIAGSRKPNDFGIGDVIFPVNVHYYEGGKSEKDSFKPRSDDVKPTFTLSEIAKVERHKTDWKELIKCELEVDVSADLGVMASGEQIVEHNDSEIGKLLSTYYDDTSCIAMEEYGFLNSVQHQGVEFTTLIAGVIRGVSDILEGSGDIKATHKSGNDRRPSNAKKLASNTAAAFAFWLILKLYQDSTKSNDEFN